ncbi:MAG: phosphodiester glycosidase family protein [Pseudomonadota bacterium]
MIAHRWVLITSAAFLALTACENQPEGEPVMRTALDGTEPTPKPEDSSENAEEEIVEAPSNPEPNATETPTIAVSACAKVSFDNAQFTHCVADPAKHRIKTVRGPGGGRAYGSLSAYAATADKTKVAFAMNAGAYGDDLRALGYYVEDGERLKLLNREEGSANFFLKPNGVFYGTAGQWRLRTTDSFLRNVSDRPNFGTQSGPMLVIDGKLHPEIQNDGPSRAVRNGVGLGADGKAHFAISEGPVSFGKIARFFKDKLGTKTALLLDSNVSALWDPATGRLDNKRAGPIVVVTKK